MPGSDASLFRADPIRRIRTSVVLIIVAACLALCAAAAHSEQTTMPLPELGQSRAHAFAINDDGMIVGMAELDGKGPVAFVIEPVGGLRHLGTLGGTTSVAVDINTHGVVVGTSENASGTPRAFAAFPDRNELVELPTLGGSSGTATAINDHGIVVGFSALPGDQTAHAYAYDLNTEVLTDLGTLGGSNSAAYGINAAGIIVGESDAVGDQTTRAFAYDLTTSTFRDLGTLGGNDAVAYDINDDGIIVGASSMVVDEPGYRAFRFDPASQAMVPIAGLGGRDSVAYHVGSDGTALGQITAPDGEAEQAFIASASGAAQIMPGLGGSMGVAEAVNTDGVVVGAATSSDDGPVLAVRFDTSPLPTSDDTAPDPDTDRNPDASTDLNADTNHTNDDDAGTRGTIRDQLSMTGGAVTSLVTGGALVLVTGGLLLWAASGRRSAVGGGAPATGIARPGRRRHPAGARPVGGLLAVALALSGMGLASSQPAAAAVCDCAALQQAADDAQSALISAQEAEAQAHDDYEAQRPALDAAVTAAAAALDAAPTAEQIEQLQTVFDQFQSDVESYQGAIDEFARANEQALNAAQRLRDLAEQALADETLGLAQDLAIDEVYRGYRGDAASQYGTGGATERQQVNRMDRHVRAAKRILNRLNLVDRITTFGQLGNAAYEALDAADRATEREGTAREAGALLGDAIQARNDAAQALHEQAAERSDAEAALAEAEAARDTARGPLDAAQAATAAATHAAQQAADALTRCQNAASDEDCDPDDPDEPGGPGGPGAPRGPRGSSFGDPHLRTFDGVFYDFHAAGEFLLVGAEHDDFAIQVRYERWSEQAHISLTTGVAIRSGDHVIVHLLNQPPTLDGAPITAAVTLDDGTHIQADGTVSLPSGTTVRVQQWPVHLNVSVALAQEDAGAVHGLLGNGDGDASDDLAIPADDDDALYEVYGPNFALSPDDRLLPGTPIPYTPPTSRVSWSDFDAHALLNATTVCLEQGWQPGAGLEVCAYDVLVTGDHTFTDPAARDFVDWENTTVTLGNAPAPEDLAQRHILPVTGGGALTELILPTHPAAVVDGPEVQILVPVEVGEVVVLDREVCLDPSYTYRMPGHDTWLQPQHPIACGPVMTTAAEESGVAVVRTRRQMFEPGDARLVVGTRTPEAVGVEGTGTVHQPPGEIAVYRPTMARPSDILLWLGKEAWCGFNEFSTVGFFTTQMRPIAHPTVVHAEPPRGLMTRAVGCSLPGLLGGELLGVSTWFDTDSVTYDYTPISGPGTVDLADGDRHTVLHSTDLSRSGDGPTLRFEVEAGDLITLTPNGCADALDPRATFTLPYATGMPEATPAGPNGFVQRLDCAPISFPIAQPGPYLIHLYNGGPATQSLTVNITEGN